MENKSNSDNKSYLRFLRNYAIAILTIVALMICYYAMWDKTDFVFGTLNDLLGILFSYLYLLAILCLHPVMIINAIKGEKGGQTSENKPHAKITGKPPSPEEIAQNKEKWKKTYRRISMAVMQLIIVDIVVTILWWIPTWPRWIALFLLVGALIYSESYRFGEQRGLYSGLGQLSIIFLGWLLGRWTGIIFFSAPLLLVYYLMLYQFAMVIVPANNPESNFVLFDKNNEKWQRFLAFIWYTWGMQYPMNVVADDWGREIPMRIKGNPFRQNGVPGIILTRAHQVAGITAGTEFSRIAGPGVIFTGRFERPLEIIDLRRQVRNSWIESVTKDGIPFKAKLFMVFKVNASSPDYNNGSFPYSIKWTRRLIKLFGVSQTTPSDKTAVRWDERVVKLIEQAARQTLSQRTLNELWQPKDRNSNTFVEIGDETISLLQQKRLEEQGVSVFTARAVDFQFPEEQQDDSSIIGQQLATWKSSWESRATQMLAEGKAEANRLQEEARAYAQSVLLRALAEGIRQTTPEISRYVIAIRFVGAIQELMKKELAVAEKLGTEVTERLEIAKQQIGQP
jgi:regulator of protease activity HflC (stomatin/prohibitin superfamily)